MTTDTESNSIAVPDEKVPDKIDASVVDDSDAPQEKSISRLRPVDESGRLLSLDVLRGVAILGILVININAFAYPFSVFSNPRLMGSDSILDDGTWVVAHFIFEHKFITIFCMMFGAGLALMASRAQKRGLRYRGIYYRRQLWLVVIGAIHAYLIWYGDILFIYALCGMIAYLFHRRTARTLVIIGVVLMCVPPVLSMAFGSVLMQERTAGQAAQAAKDAGDTLSKEQEDALKAWDTRKKQMVPTEEKLAKNMATFRGGYGGILVAQFKSAVGQQIFTLLFYGLWRVIGLMLIGMAFMKWGILSAARSRAFYLRCVAIGYAVGAPIVAYSAYLHFHYEFDFVHLLEHVMNVNYVGSLFVALGHIGLVMLVCQSQRWQGLKTRLASVGRAALSNYLFHSVVMTFIFYGWGLGLFARFNRFSLMGFVIGMWLLQLWISPIWLRRYRFGPVEWLWRSATYWRRQPMRRVA